MCGGDAIGNPCSNTLVSRAHVTCFSLSAASHVVLALRLPRNHPNPLVTTIHRTVAKLSMSDPSISRESCSSKRVKKGREEQAVTTGAKLSSARSVPPLRASTSGRVLAHVC